MNQAIPSSNVQVGSVVTVREEGLGETQRFQLVLPHQTSMGSDTVSSSSPFGQAVLNAATGTTVTVAAPVGEVRFEVLKIE